MLFGSLHVEIVSLLSSRGWKVEAIRKNDYRPECTEFLTEDVLIVEVIVSPIKIVVASPEIKRRGRQMLLFVNAVDFVID